MHGRAFYGIEAVEQLHFVGSLDRLVERSASSKGPLVLSHVCVSIGDLGAESSRMSVRACA